MAACESTDELASLQAALRDAAADPRYSDELLRLKELPGAQQVVCDVAGNIVGARNLLAAVHEHRAAAFITGVCLFACACYCLVGLLRTLRSGAEGDDYDSRLSLRKADADDEDDELSDDGPG